MGTLFPRLDPARLASLLEKVLPIYLPTLRTPLSCAYMPLSPQTAPTPACSNKFIPKMARGTVRSIVKNLRQAL